MEYSRNMSYLGLTGQLYLDCYSGECQKYVKKICEDERCHYSDEYINLILLIKKEN